MGLGHELFVQVVVRWVKKGLLISILPALSNDLLNQDRGA